MILKRIGSLSHKKIRIGLYIMFSMYLLLMFWEVFIGPYRSYSGVRRYNLYPFNTIIEYIFNSSKYNFQVVFINIIANIITFIPLGFFISLLFKKSFKLINSALFCSLIIISIEMGQFILNVGVLDVDDLILNTVGCVLGIISYKVVRNFIKIE